jgi:hypothetical protein
VLVEGRMARGRGRGGRVGRRCLHCCCTAAALPLPLARKLMGDLAFTFASRLPLEEEPQSRKEHFNRRDNGDQLPPPLQPQPENAILRSILNAVAPKTTNGLHELMLLITAGNTA